MHKKTLSSELSSYLLKSMPKTRTVKPKKVIEPTELTGDVSINHNHKTIYDSLFAFQKEKIIIPRKLPGKAANGKTYNYASLDDIISMTRDPLQKHGLMYTQTIYQDEKSSTFLKTSLIALNATAEPKMLETSIPLGIPQSAQDMGARITYMRRYALVPILGLSVEDDTDAVVPDITYSHNTSPHKVEGGAVEAVVKAIGDIQVGAFSELKEGAPDKDFVYTSETAKKKLQDVINEMQKTSPLSAAHRRALDTVSACQNEEALEMVKDRIAKSERLNDPEKSNLADIIKLKETELSGTVHVQ